MKKRSSLGYRLVIFLGLFLLLNRACSPPGIDIGYAKKLLTVSEVYQDVRQITDLPVAISGKVTTSLFIGSLGGFFFLQDPEAHKTIVCLTKDFPPPDGATVNVYGIVKPFICKDDVNILYLKTEVVKTERQLSANYP